MNSKMTGKQFRKMRELLGFKKRKFIAERCGVGTSCVAKWEGGDRPVPEYAVRILKSLWKTV